MMMPLADINARILSIQTGTMYIQVDVNTIYTYLKIRAMHTVSPLVPPPPTSKMLKYNKRNVVQLSWLA